MRIADSRLVRIGKLRIALERIENYFAENPHSGVEAGIAACANVALTSDDEYAVQERLSQRVCGDGGRDTGARGGGASMTTRRYTAHEVAASPDLYNCTVRFNNSFDRWECMGYSGTGRTIRFARLVTTEAGIHQINRYVAPFSVVTVEVRP